MHTLHHCIALRAIPVSDSRVLLSVWSSEAGRLTLAFPSGGSREARRRRALTPPLAFFEGCIDVRPDREIHSMRDFLPSAGTIALAPTDITRNFQASFLGEFLDALLRRFTPESSLNAFLFNSIALLGSLSNKKALANFHIAFLVKLLHHAGIEPILDDYRSGAVFDMRDALFRSSAPLHRDFIDPDDSAAILPLARITFRNMHLYAYTREERRLILDNILTYYSIHSGNLPTFKTLSIVL